MSTAAMKSRPAIASPSRLPSGVEETGLPATVSSARTWPVARGEDLVGQRRDRQLAAELRQVADPAAPQVVVAAADELPAHDVDRRAG